MEVSSDDLYTELCSYANVVVLGSNSLLFEINGRTFHDQPFSSDIDMAKDVPIVDGSLAYDFPHTGAVCVLVLRNALYIPSMEHNLIPPFIMIASGVIVDDVSKIHYKNPVVDDNRISFDHSNLRITLHLNDVFSYFHTIVPH